LTGLDVAQRPNEDWSRATADIEPALESFARQPNGGLILTADAFTGLSYSLIANLAGRYRLPSIASGASPDYAPR
jgi:hypothetical protein